MISKSDLTAAGSNGGLKRKLVEIDADPEDRFQTALHSAPLTSNSIPTNNDPSPAPDSRRRRMEPSFQVMRQNPIIQNGGSKSFTWKVQPSLRPLGNARFQPVPTGPLPVETQFILPSHDPNTQSSRLTSCAEPTKAIKSPQHPPCLVKAEHRAPMLQNVVDWTTPITKNTIALPHVPACLAHPVTPATNSLPLVKKHPAYFLFDGNVLLQLEKVRFKLHESRLALISPLFARIFKDTRTLLGSSNWVRERKEWKGITWSEDEDGFILCILDGTGVSLNDFEVLLDMMDNSLIYSHINPSFDIIASVLRAATVLEFHNLRAWSLRCLLDTRHILKLGESGDVEITLHSIAPNPHPRAAESLRLARHCGETGIIKLALYDLARSASPVTDESVSAKDLELISSARARLAEAWNRFAAAPSFASSCPSPSDANTSCILRSPPIALEKHLTAIHGSGIFSRYQFDPIRGLLRLMDMRNACLHTGYCVGCVEKRAEEWNKGIYSIWEQMDDWFGLNH